MGALARFFGDRRGAFCEISARDIRVVDIRRLLNHRVLRVAALVGVVAGFLGTLWWTFLFFTLGPQPLPVEAPPQASTGNAADIPIERVVAMHLFGEPSGNPAPQRERLSETKLSLILHGVFVSDQAEASSALISQRGANPQLYAIAERLPGNARLEEVYRDRVVVSRGGVRENLSFIREDQIIQPGGEGRAGADLGRSSAPKQTAARTAQRHPRSLIARTLAKHRDEIDRDPRAFIEALGLRTSERGGYVLGTFADADSGLEPGDRLLSLNGKPVGNPEQDRRHLEQVLGGNAVEVRLQRGEQLIQFRLSLDALD